MPFSRMTGAGCHTPVKGVERDKCVACHANDTHIVARQPTAFHTDIKECASCHVDKGESGQHFAHEPYSVSRHWFQYAPQPKCPV